MTATAETRLERPPLEGVLRETPFALIRATDQRDDDTTDDGRTLDGYAAVFNRVTIIDSWEGRFKERIAPGAMKKSFRENPPRIQFDHGRHPVVGSIPIAKLEDIREEADPELAPDGGAHVIGRLHENWLVEPVREAISTGSINGMSFRFSVVREEWHDHEGKKITDEQELRELLRRTWYEDVPDEELLTRTLKELKVPEVGPVVWPAYADTSVGVRSQTLTIDLARLDEPDQRNMLARAVLMADRAEAGEKTPPSTDPAGEHVDEPTVTPDDTARAAVDHAAESRRLARASELEAVRAVLTTIPSTKEKA